MMTMTMRMIHDDDDDDDDEDDNVDDDDNYDDDDDDGVPCCHPGHPPISGLSALSHASGYT